MTGRIVLHYQLMGVVNYFGTYTDSLETSEYQYGQKGKLTGS